MSTKIKIEGVIKQYYEPPSSTVYIWPNSTVAEPFKMGAREHEIKGGTKKLLNCTTKGKDVISSISQPPYEIFDHTVSSYIDKMVKKVESRKKERYFNLNKANFILDFLAIFELMWGMMEVCERVLCAFCPIAWKKFSQIVPIGALVQKKIQPVASIQKGPHSWKFSRPC